MSTDDLIRLDNVAKEYVRGSERIAVLRGISLGIAAGTVVGSAMVLFAFAVSTILRYPHPPFLAVPFGCGVAAMLGAIGGLFGREFSPVSSPEPELLSIVS